MISIQVQEIKYHLYEMYMIDKVYEKYVKIQIYESTVYEKHSTAMR